MAKHPPTRYSTTEAAGGGLILMRNGSEIGTADDGRTAARMAADDMLAGWPEACPDFMSDLADRVGEDLPDVVRTRSFGSLLTEEILGTWPAHVREYVAAPEIMSPAH